MQLNPGRELDALVAEKIFGYTLDYEFADTLGAPCVPELRDQYDEWGMLPHYSTDMSDAWTILETLERQDWYARVGHYQIKPVRWNCRLVPASAPEAYVFADAPTATVAICFAGLKAVGVEVT